MWLVGRIEVCVYLGQLSVYVGHVSLLMVVRPKHVGGIYKKYK